jgi:PPOX class probable F420-dependent enzyme
MATRTPAARALAGAAVPDSHRDLLDRPPVAALTTSMPDGSPHTTPVWCEFDGVHVLVNTMRGFLKERNMRRDPRVTLLCYDPARPLRSLEVRGRVVELTEAGAAEHLDRLGELYTGRPFFSDLAAAGAAGSQIPVLCRILPLRVVTLDAE